MPSITPHVVWGINKANKCVSERRALKKQYLLYNNLQ